METIGLFSGVLLFSVQCLLSEVRAGKLPIAIVAYAKTYTEYTQYMN